LQATKLTFSPFDALVGLSGRVLRPCGLELTRYNPEKSEGARLAHLLERYRIDCVFDVGANAGQYAKGLRRLGYQQRIISFEPQRAAHAALRAASAKDPLWDVPAAVAIGDFDGETEINVAANSLSSSIRPMAAAHEEAAPYSKYKGTETVKVARLDSIFDTSIGSSTRPYLKIDTQGYESQVLIGATTCLKRFIGVQVELSLVELYTGQELFFDIAERLRQKDFSMVGLLPGFVDPRSGHLLQADGLFFRQE
jgi:FkbM family methyltransferase